MRISKCYLLLWQGFQQRKHSCQQRIGLFAMASIPITTTIFVMARVPNNQMPWPRQDANQDTCIFFCHGLGLWNNVMCVQMAWCFLAYWVWLNWMPDARQWNPYLMSYRHIICESTCNVWNEGFYDVTHDQCYDVWNNNPWNSSPYFLKRSYFVQIVLVCCLPAFLNDVLSLFNIEI